MKVIALGILFGLLAGILIGSQAKAETGMASFYGGKHHGRPMANGQRFDQNSDSCAHKSLPFGTSVTVTTRAGRRVRCVVRDRGPYRRGRIVDVSVAAARALHMVAAGVVPVTVERAQ
jgi:rare lipoprotein A